MLLAGVVAYGVATALILRVVVRLTRWGLTGRDFWQSVVLQSVPRQTW